MSPLELVDDRFEQLARELREARPVASEDLRGRIRVLAPPGPVARRSFRRDIAWGRSTKRAALALALVAIAVPLVGAGIKGLQGSDSRQRSVPAAPTIQHGAAKNAGGPVPVTQNKEHFQPQFRTDTLRSAIGPNLTRLQQYGASLRLRVDDVDALSNATKRAMTITRALGGYVAGVGYTTRAGRRGGAHLILRVPIQNVPTAIERLSALGTILGQQVSVLDVQRRADRQVKAIQRLHTDLARIEALLGTSLSPATRARLEQEATADRLALETLRRRHKALLRRAHFSKIDLRLQTRTPKQAASAGRFENTLDDAGAVLVRELEILLYALVVVGPLLVLGALAIGAGRVQRRRADARLLERS